MADKYQFEGEVCGWSAGEGTREYIVATVPFEVARRFLKADPFSAATGQGEQRNVQAAHVRKLRAEMAAGNYTPTSFSAGLRPPTGRPSSGTGIRRGSR